MSMFTSTVWSVEMFRKHQQMTMDASFLDSSNIFLRHMPSCQTDIQGKKYELLVKRVNF